MDPIRSSNLQKSTNLNPNSKDERLTGERTPKNESESEDESKSMGLARSTNPKKSTNPNLNPKGQRLTGREGLPKSNPNPWIRPEELRQRKSSQRATIWSLFFRTSGDNLALLNVATHLHTQTHALDRSISIHTPSQSAHASSS